MFKWLTESIKSFRNKGDSNYSEKAMLSRSGEGVEEFNDNNLGYGVTGLTSFNLFYKNYLQKSFQNELEKIGEYRRMATMPEISDVIDDIVVEATQENKDGEIINLTIFDEDINKNENITKILYDEFNNLFYNKLDINEKLPELIKTYVVDGRVYFERIISERKRDEGIVGIKKLPTETMDYNYNPKTGKINFFYQIISSTSKIPNTFEEAEADPGIVAFYPEQIGFIDYGVYGRTRKDVKGYLDNVGTPYNQLKLLEVSIIIYRVIRAPERLVYKIDTGSMPRDKALKFVEKIKQSMSKKQSYDSVTGKLTNEPSLLGMLDNYLLPQCLSLKTRIPLLNGRTKTLSELIDDYNNGIRNEVFSIDQTTGSIVKGGVTWAGVTRKNADLVRVTLDNGEHVDCTPDHKCVLRRSEEVEAKDIKEYTTLMTNSLVVNHKVVKVETLDYKEDTGCLTVVDRKNNHNFALSCGVFVKNSADGRGSDISTISGNFDALKTLEDLYYFQKKLYSALRYPISRIISRHEKSEEPLFGGRSGNEISRDEVKWGKLLERKVQNPFSNVLLDLFLLHLEFKGLKKQYDLNRDKLSITFNAPSYYKEHQQQMHLETRTSNYMALANNPEFSKYYLMREYLGWTDEEIKANADGHKKDIKLGFKQDPSEMEGGFGQSQQQKPEEPGQDDEDPDESYLKEESF